MLMRLKIMHVTATDVVFGMYAGLPKVTVNPPSHSVEVAQPVTFTAIVDGIGEDNYYQWRHNEGFINGKTGDTLTIESVTEDDAGKYDCLINNEFEDCVISQPSELSENIC